MVSGKFLESGVAVAPGTDRGSGNFARGRLGICEMR